MPSPFTHLHISEKIREDIGNMQHENENNLKFLVQGWPSFYFGSVAPDFQALSGHPREMTHFFKLPPEAGNQAYPKMFTQFPKLAMIDQISVEQAAFIAAYATHLLLDLIWFRQVLIPYFHLAENLGDINQRRLLHLILLTYIDKLSFSQLPETAGQTLSNANPIDCLPFASDGDLKQWQEFLVIQLQPGAISETVRIYANRLQMTPKSFAAKLENRGWMEDNLFSKIPVNDVIEVVYSAVPKSIELVNKYFNDGFTDEK